MQELTVQRIDPSPRFCVFLASFDVIASFPPRLAHFLAWSSACLPHLASAVLKFKH